MAALAAQEDEQEPPKQPEVLSRIREAKRFGVPVFQGEIMKWPSIAREELNACYEAEHEYTQIKINNALRQAEYDNAQTSKPS